MADQKGKNNSEVRNIQMTANQKCNIAISFIFDKKHKL